MNDSWINGYLTPCRKYSYIDVLGSVICWQIFATGQTPDNLQGLKRKSVLTVLLLFVLVIQTIDKIGIQFLRLKAYYPLSLMDFFQADEVHIPFRQANHSCRSIYKISLQRRGTKDWVPIGYKLLQRWVNDSLSEHVACAGAPPEEVPNNYVSWEHWFIILRKFSLFFDDRC